MTGPWRTAFLVLAALCGGAAQAQHQHGGTATPACNEPTLACAGVATPAFGPDGRLWLAWANGSRVMVAASRDLGRGFGPAAAVAPAPERLDTGPDSRPTLVVGADGRITVAYAIFQDDKYNGRVQVSRSRDGGASFSPPRPITDDPTSQRFETLALDPGGGLFAAWIDKRNASAARLAGRNYVGAALAVAWGEPDGTGFAPARVAVDNICECCRLAVAFAGPGRPVVLFRGIFGGTTRDHAVLTFADRETPGPLRRVSADEWKTNTCPHHGPSLAIGGHGTYHAAWFTDGAARKGVFYARSRDGGATFDAPLAIGAPDARAARPALAALGDKVWLAWKEFDGKRAAVRAIASADDGATWSAPRTLATAADASDHPLLIANAGSVYLSWLSRDGGYRLIPVEGSE